MHIYAIARCEFDQHKEMGKPTLKTVYKVVDDDDDYDGGRVVKGFSLLSTF